MSLAASTLLAAQTAFAAGEPRSAKGFVPGEGAKHGKVTPTRFLLAPQSSPATDMTPAYESKTGSIFLPLPGSLIGSVTPSADAAVAGMWTSLADWPVVAIHASVLPNGHVLTYGTPLGVSQQDSQAFDDWNPSQGLVDASHTVTANPTPINSFCSAATLVGGGALLVTGGNSATSTSVWAEANRTFTPITSTAPLLYPRWYASVVRLPDNRVLTVGGAMPYAVNAYETPSDDSAISTTPEIFSAAIGWSQLNGATSSDAFGAQDNRWWYPKAYLAPNGSVFGVSANMIWSLNPSGNGSVKVLGQLNTTGVGASATSAMFDAGKILLVGGGNVNNSGGAPSSNQATVFDINNPVPVVSSTSAMHFARGWATAVALPTGRVLVLGGTQVGDNGGTDAVYSGEVWDPASGTWAQTAPSAAIRVYHSSAILLPDGSVLNAGGGVPGPVDNFNAQVFFPPYLFARHGKSVVWAERPSIVAMSQIPAYGHQVRLTLAKHDKIASVSLVSLASETHGHNTDQRRIPLDFVQSGPGVTMTIPSSAALLPPGFYQLHVVDSDGVPSVGVVIELKV